MLRTVSTSEETYKILKNDYLKIYNSFKDFAQLLTDKAGKVTKTSNKADSYANTLIKISVLYKEIFEETIPPEELDTFKGLTKLKKITKVDGYKKFNSKGSHFISATLGCFTAYITNLYNDVEFERDDVLNNDLNKLSPKQEMKIIYSNEEKSSSIPPKKIFNKKMAYNRSVREALISKRKSNYKCELDNTHSTFMSSIDGNNFVEAHHLIPMSVQDNYKNTLDFADNIVTLCPNCHRLIHHADPETKRKAVNKLFDERKHLYPQHHIKIDKKTLQNYYGII